jgi:hypothetical protein
LAVLLRKRLTDRVWMIDRARRNSAEAQAYRAELLDKRRMLFWSNFRQSAMLQRAGNAG